MSWTVPIAIKSKPPIITNKNTFILPKEDKNDKFNNSQVKENEVPAIKTDVITFREQIVKLKDNEVITLANNVYKPDMLYKFPKRDGRCFRMEWLDQFSWLCYSPSVDGAFCLHCVLFGDKFPSKNGKTKRLVTEPFFHWTKASSFFKQHEAGKQGLHQHTSSFYLTLKNQLSGKEETIHSMIDSQYKKNVENNRQKLRPIVDTVKLCGHLNLPLRGHRDDSKYHPEVGQYGNSGVGNFVELLNFRVRSGDVTLKNHMETCQKNASYISKTAQNEIINCAGNVITENIVKEIKINKFFSIIADEATDSSNEEQMSLVLRYVNSQNEIKEDFIRFLACSYGITGADLENILLEALSDLGLDIMDARGQGYDGAGNVSGHTKGLASRILRINPKAFYTHCHSHRLNLAIMKACSIDLVVSVLDQIKEIYYFFANSPNREKILNKQIDCHCSHIKKEKLKDPCRTRWIERIKGIDTFQQAYIAIYYTFLEMRQNQDNKFNPTTKHKAASFLEMISKFSFIISMVVTRQIFDLTIDVTTNLQAREIDIQNCNDLIETLINSTKKYRDNIDQEFQNWYEEALNIAKSVEVDEWFPRINSSKRQQHRDNTPAENAREYYKRSLAIPFIDYFINELDVRFSKGQEVIFCGLAILPSNIIKYKSWKSDFLKFCNFYKDDFPNFVSIQAELQLWETYWSNKTKPKTVAETLKKVNFNAFGNIKTALRILGTLPVTSCECERSISALRRLKDYTRTTMVNERLNGLALMYIHKDLNPDVEEIINKFSSGNRRLDFT